MNDYGRRRSVRLDVDIDKCALKYAAGACTAGTDVATGTSQTGATADTIKLAAGASAVDDFYNGNAVTLADGRRNIITDYDGTTKIATVRRQWEVNLLTKSDAFDNAAWAKTGGTITADAARAPDGRQIADLFTEDASSGDHAVAYANVAGLADSTNYRVAIVVRPNGRDWVRLLWTDKAAAATSVYFNVTTGEIGTDPTGTARIERTEFGDFRITATFGTGTGGNVPDVGLYLADSDGGGSYTGDGSSGVYLSNAHLCRATDSYEYVSADTVAVDFPDSTAYRIVEVGGECYNTFRTCQDPANYSRGAKRWSFATPGDYWPQDDTPRPYIVDETFAPMEIDLENGLAVRASATIEMGDESGSDIEADPYYETRSEPAGGTFWSRWAARNNNYADRPAILSWAYLPDGYDASQYTVERYIIENVNGPDGNNIVKFTFKDPTKLADRAKHPVATDAKLAGALSTTDLSMTLEGGDGALFGSSGHVRVNDEIIKFTSRAGDTLSWSDLSLRGQFGTAIEAHDEGDSVQDCVTWIDAPVSTVLEDLLSSAGMDASYIDSAGFQSEDALWLSTSFHITTCISEPTLVSKMLKEILIQIGAYMFWHPVEQLTKFKVIAPVAPGAGVVGTLTDAAAIIENSAKVERLDDLRRTQTAIYYDRRSATNDDNELKSYGRVEVAIDISAQTENEYGGVRSEEMYSRWFPAASALGVRASVSRRTSRYRDAPQRVIMHVDPKDADLQVGDLVDVTMRQIVDIAGKASTTRMLVTQRKDERGRIRLRLRATTLGKRYAFVAPSSVGDYPDGSDYAHVVDGAILTFPDGTGPYYVF